MINSREKRSVYDAITDAKERVCPYVKMELLVKTSAILKTQRESK